MEPVLTFLLSYILLYKYIALFLIVFSAAIILPLPVTELMFAVGAFVNQGYFNFAATLIISQVANVLGDLVGYFITHKYGYGVIHKFKLDRSRFFERMKEELNIHVRSTIFITRFAGGLGPAANFLSGAVRVPLKLFFIYDFLGNLIYFLGILLIGNLAGSYWENFSQIISIFVSIIMVTTLLLGLWHLYKRLKRNHAAKLKE
ncbi:DedA family protein [Patescibacteria group bacterium]|nr:DedA family protein [Patescibacteria group bacterium]